MLCPSCLACTPIEIYKHNPVTLIHLCTGLIYIYTNAFIILFIYFYTCVSAFFFCIFSRTEISVSSMKTLVTLPLSVPLTPLPTPCLSKLISPSNCTSSFDFLVLFRAAYHPQVLPDHAPTKILTSKE